ncbi:3-phosphoshikimate 1-carboxyvinyltransferase [Curtobacterium pusillum]|uniref:3-phosphoshikimate 1-carboxyvinyltransferase n=1 Tax=Curtobacterium pusillum TaxID=69373 RepID=A0ABX2M698_9MICO|nr:3-phosphoshikimate 1-carboxyvinyltransferase [Curtobacterium pusillum]NUU13450.1 3-phosphoshikimate 1-carboxyvinyltransferase [Curtobacterium pusillum]GLK29820.1 3-phosphoshikimate 1-carboxyvinyltransferase [Curtobacterium pusillum]
MADTTHSQSGTRSRTEPWIAPLARGPLRGDVSLPGSKSLTNRELVLAALADGPSTIRLPLHSRDSALMVAGLRQLGVGVDEVAPGPGEAPNPYGPDLRIRPAPMHGDVRLDCGLAGTVMRFLPPLAALAVGPVTVDGDPYARKRPMHAIIRALVDLGVDVTDDGDGAMPFSFTGTGSVRGGALSIDASASSQFVSGLLLSAPRFDEGLHLTHVGERLPSLPHIDMTVAALRARGVRVDEPAIGEWVVHPGPIAARDVTIEPDLSNAAPFAVAALVAGGTVRIRTWPTETTQVGADLETLLPLWGATVTRDGDDLVFDGGVGVRGGASLPGLDLDLSRGGELAPSLVALAALAGGPTEITGIGHLRGHETDRLAALAEDVNRSGGAVRELEEGLRIEPVALHGGHWGAYDDHRMATAGAIVGLVVDGVAVDDIGSTAKTLPQFPELWADLVGSADTHGGSSGVTR